MKSFKDVSKQLDEVLTKSTPAGEWVHDFVHSDNPKFKGKSAAKRKQMALAAYYAKKNEGASPSQNSTVEVDMNESKDTSHVVNHDSEDVKASHNYVHKNAEAVAKRNNGKITRHSDNHTEISYPNGHTTHIKTTSNGKQAVSHIKHHYSESVGLDEDQYTSDYKIKHYVDPITGESKTRKIRPHRVDFKNSKMRGEPAQKDSEGDYGMKEDVKESRGHKVLSTFFKNRDIVRDMAKQSPEEKAEHEKKHREAMTKAHNEYVKKNPNSIFKPMKEEAEQIDELSKHKLVQYIDKASQDVHNKALEAGKDSDKPAKASDFIKKYQKSGKRQAGITKAAVKLAREEVELEEDLDKDTIHQLLANKDINAQVKGGKVHVHSSDVKAAKMHLGAAGHKHEVVGGLNEDQEEDDRQGAEHHQKELEQQELEAKKKKEKVKEEVQIDELSKGTLSSYIKNATKDYGYARRYQDKNAKDIHGDDRDLKQVRSKRFVGISKAADKLAKEEANLDEGKRGLWDNIHAKRKRIAAGSGERMRKPGSKGAPSNQDLKNSQEEVKESFEYNFNALEEAVKSIDRGEYDYEGQMSRTQLQTTMRNCQDLIGMIKNDDNMPEWVQSKITLSQDYISTVRDYLQSKEELGEGKVYDPFTKKMVNTKPIKVQAGGGATRNGVPVETGPSKYKEKLKNEEVQIDELSKELVARYANKVAKTTQDNYDKSKDKFQFSSGREDGMKNAVKRLTKEESEQIDEISKGTLASYIKKSKDQAGLIAHDLGHRIGSSPDAGVTLKPSYVKDKGKYVQRSKGINRAAEKLAKEATEYKGIGTDVVDKKKVLNPPIPLTQKAKQVKDFKEGDEYDEKWKEYKGKSFKKESVMLKFNDFLEEAKKCTDEELVGKQHKIDKNKNGKIDADDFKKLRKEETESIEESYPTKQHFEQMAALIKSHDDDKKRSDLAHHHAGIFKGQNPRFDHKKFMHACGVHESAVCEEIEPIEELSKGTLASYVPKAAKSARIHGQISSEYKSASDRARKSSMKDSLERLSKKYKNKAWKRDDGIKRAVDKLAKEEVEQIDELSKGTLASYAKASTFDAAKQGNEIAKLGNNLSALSKVNGPMYKLNKRLAGHGKAVDKLAKEEVEQIDEISKNTLGSYVKKASSDIADRQERIRAGSKPYPGESQADYQKDMSKALALQSKRKAGMDKAVDKLTKEEVEQEQSPYLKATLAVMDEGKIDNLRDAQALRKAGGSSYEKELKPDAKHPHIQVVKGTSYGGENQKDDEHDEKSDDGEKRGRGRPSGSKSGAR